MGQRCRRRHYEAYVANTFKAAAPQVLARYPVSACPSPKLALAALLTDVAFACPTRARARAMSNHQPSIFLYQFTHVTETGAMLELGSWHGSELEFVFGTLRNREESPATSQELELSNAMMGYWAQFARTGSPTFPGAPPWSAYTLAEDRNQRLQTPIDSEKNLKKSNCDFFDLILGT